MILLAGRYTHRCWHERTMTTAPDQNLLARTAHIDDVWIMNFTNSLGRVGKMRRRYLRPSGKRCDSIWASWWNVQAMRTGCA